MDTANAHETAGLGLFEGYGIEIEYMIVDAESLSVLPVTDRVLYEMAGDYVTEVEAGELAWSNELALHVIELKTNGPAPSLNALPAAFQHDIARIHELLLPLNGRLMPTAMHPWMDPYRETHLWPHENSVIYETFDKIFSCQGHGWANLQSMHINLPFANDREFARLHAAIRLLLPLLPALAASSPIVDSRITGLMDNRLDTYRNNAARIPSVSGKVIPEPVFTRRDYEQLILDQIYRDLATHDPDGVLRYEWLNARGAIARFDRNAIEVRVLDTQECPQADLAVGAAVIETVRAHVDQAWCDLSHQQAWDIDPLYEIFLQTMAEADRALIENRRYLDAFGFPERGGCLAGELWQHLIETLAANNKESASVWGRAWAVLTQRGPLARRILRALGNDSDANAIRRVYGDLCDCLSTGKMFVA